MSSNFDTASNEIENVFIDLNSVIQKSGYNSLTPEALSVHEGLRKSVSDVNIIFHTALLYSALTKYFLFQLLKLKISVNFGAKTRCWTINVDLWQLEISNVIFCGNS